MPLVLLVILLVAGALAYRWFSRRKQRQELLASRLYDREWAAIARMVPIAARLPAEYRATYEGKINLFLDQIDFIGCDGLEVTDNMRLSIAAQACLLVANSPAWYDSLRTVLIYPGAFRSLQQEHDGFVVRERNEVRLGESWSRGPVVLSWAHTEQGAMNDEDGHNIVFHEFAHQLDDLSGSTDAVPVLRRGQRFADWERVFLDAYDTHVDNVEAGRRTVLDAYGAQSHVEFFAVAVEVFFEKPVRLKEQEPEVYDQLAQLFRLDPVTW